jgi:hypothetical protein
LRFSPLYADDDDSFAPPLPPDFALFSPIRHDIFAFAAAFDTPSFSLDYFHAIYAIILTLIAIACAYAERAAL